MNDHATTRLSEPELEKFFQQLFPNGIAGTDVVEEIAPEGWVKSPLLACHHPRPEQALAEHVRRHRQMRELRGEPPAHQQNELARNPEPVMDDVLAAWEEHPINIAEEVTEIVCRCLWDIFSDNHKVIAPDGRLVDIGSFRVASAFLADLVDGLQSEHSCVDEYRFYMGSILISQRADLTPIYQMIFRRLKSLGADWSFDCPSPYLRKQTSLQTMDPETPKTAQAYQQVYGAHPKGWTPAEIGGPS